MSEKRRVRKTGKRLILAYALRSFAVVVPVLIATVFVWMIFFKDVARTSAGADGITENNQTEKAAWETDAAQKLSLSVQGVTVMIDPGHGGEDPGTTSGTVDEKDITLKVALLVRDYLKECGANVIMTREDDTFINKYDRAALANEKEADLFLSIHCNYLEDNPEISGVETYYMENADDGMELATAVHEQVLSVTGADDMYVRTNDFVVIRETNMTAALIEIGYLSNAQDVKLLSQKEYQQKMAYGIAAGITAYLNQYN